ncbi:MAG: restriction endonuclease subunit S [Bacteroidales bacterium]|nr:restriction endonuclease subunit S [Bacteroidales bacterium]
MEQYSSYKDSGFEWIGKIPSHWGLLKSKFLWRESFDTSATGMEDLLSVSQYDGITPANGSRSESLVGYKVVEENNLVINIMLAWMGGLGVSAFNGLVSPAYCVYKLLGNNNPKYMHYLYKTPMYLAEFARHSTGVIPSRWRMYTDDFGQVITLILPRKEQDAMVAYLDATTAKIDEAIAQQQRMIDLLSERKQIIIDKTTTKGAFSGKELHDSGVDYIGEIPEGWTTTKIKFVASYNDEVLSEDSADKDIEYVEIGDVQYGKGITGSANYLFKDAPSRARRITRKGDIIVSTVRTYLKAVAVIKKDGLIVSTGFVVIRPKSNVDAQFLAYAILNSAIISEVEKNSVGTSYPAVNAWEVVDIKVPIPPIEEQKRIALYLSEIEKNTEKAIEGCGKIIQALQERKQIIINNVVTGKVKVV